MSISEPLLPAPVPVPLSPVSRKTTQPSHTILTLDSPPTAQPAQLPSTSQPSLLSTRLERIYDNLPPQLTNFISQNVGLSLVAAAQLFMVLMSLTVKYFLSTTKISAFTLIFVRMSITSLFCVLSLIFVIKDKNPILGPEGIRRLLLLRGFFGFMGLLGMYQALRGLTVSDAVTIQFLAPTLTALLGYLLLNEKMSWREVVAGFCCLAGVVLVSRPTFIFGGLSEDGPHAGGPGGGTRLDLPPPPPGEGDTEGIQTPQRAVSVAWAFVCVFFTAVAYTTIRGIGDKAHALHSIGYFSYLCTICTGLYMLFNPQPTVFVHNFRDFLFIITIGIFGFCGQTLLTLGLQREKAGRAGIAIYTQVVFSLVLEFLIWQTIPSFLSMLGTVIILSSALWATMSRTKPLPPAQPTDPESLPFSRSPSPIPPPHSDRPTLRGEHYSYDSVRSNDSNEFVIGDEDGDANVTRKGSSGDLLDIPSSSHDGSRRGSNASGR
ncbi:hypothetical protein I302_107852 [Kwoniella bestiolae CBS 10118]|uniref:EamA domain-containing protein n=1 Tax=Kwoniella bestiolae CBS 10118 TaxID=1296100 RepID=A0A1B9FXC9_9TREE|nr:hypothetical protein I302_06408 [Kwoniella bestiolae CBS 10118]OCF23426.1 hypothetical protein I302_06408 [Kwoniella bestiolae CBS 10118]